MLAAQCVSTKKGPRWMNSARGNTPCLRLSFSRLALLSTTAKPSSRRFGYLLFLLSRLGAREAQTGELFNQQRAIAILENDERATAGEILGQVRKFVRLSDGINKRLTDALRARNAIVHRFFTDNVERMVDVREHEKLIRELNFEEECSEACRGSILSSVPLRRWTTAQSTSTQ